MGGIRQGRARSYRPVRLCPCPLVQEAPDHDRRCAAGCEARLAQSREAAARIAAAGFVTIGLDHFAKPSDGMTAAAASRELARNFQGYTVDGADALIGLGASSIGRLPQGHVQNMLAIGQYEQMVGKGGLAVMRGIELSPEDRVRGWVIERLMCDLGFSRAELRESGGHVVEHLPLHDLDAAQARQFDDALLLEL